MHVLSVNYSFAKYIVPIAISISFTQSMYSVIESAGRIQPTLAISNPSLIDITVEIFTTNVTALGKY